MMLSSSMASPGTVQGKRMAICRLLEKLFTHVPMGRKEPAQVGFELTEAHGKVAPRLR